MIITVIIINVIYFFKKSGLVIDGSIAYPFNDGNKVLLEVRPEDSLLTISME